MQNVMKKVVPKFSFPGPAAVHVHKHRDHSDHLESNKRCNDKFSPDLIRSSILQKSRNTPMTMEDLIVENFLKELTLESHQKIKARV
eukprot:Awhi_evm1s11564